MSRMYAWFVSTTSWNTTHCGFRLKRTELGWMDNSTLSRTVRNLPLPSGSALAACEKYPLVKHLRICILASAAFGYSLSALTIGILNRRRYRVSCCRMLMARESALKFNKRSWHHLPDLLPLLTNALYTLSRLRWSPSSTQNFRLASWTCSLDARADCIYTFCTDSMAAIVRISSLHLYSPDDSNILPSMGSIGNSASCIPRGIVSRPTSSSAFREYKSSRARIMSSAGGAVRKSNRRTLSIPRALSCKITGAKLLLFITTACQISRQMAFYSFPLCTFVSRARLYHAVICKSPRCTVEKLCQALPGLHGQHVATPTL